MSELKGLIDAEAEAAEIAEADQASVARSDAKLNPRTRPGQDPANPS